MCSQALRGVRRVDHDHQLVVEAIDGAVVDEGALGREDRRVLHLARLERADVVAGDPVDEGVPVGPGDLELAHVGDVEDPGAAPHRLVLGEDAGRVLHRHLPAGERAPSWRRGATWRVVERGALERRSVRRSSFGCPSHQGRHERLLDVQPVLGLVPDAGLRPLDHLLGDLLAAVRGEAVQEDGAPVGQASSGRSSTM